MDFYSKLKEMRILLIEDDQWIRNSMRLFFEAEGCLLVALETAEEGLEAVKRQGYDIIIVDYMLPGMDGLEFFRQIQRCQSRAIKIFITAYGSEYIVAEAIKLGVHDFIEKPFTTKAIEKSLSRLIKKNKGN